MPPPRGGNGMEVDLRNHPFAPGLPRTGRQSVTRAPPSSPKSRYFRANLKSISHRCHLVFVWKLTKETIHLPLGCLQGVTTGTTFGKRHLTGKLRAHNLAASRCSIVQSRARDQGAPHLRKHNLRVVAIVPGYEPRARDQGAHHWGVEGAQEW